MTQCDGASLELVAEQLSFPTSVAFDDNGVAYIAESGLPFGGARPGGRVWRLAPDGSRDLVADRLRPPVNGLTYFEGGLFASEGGHPARISRFDLNGRQTVILDNLPGPGNYHTNMVTFGPDGWLYFSQGAMTNTAIVGLDAYEMGWLRRLPHAHDIPGLEIALAGINVETSNPLSADPAALTRTGAFAPFGVANDSGQRIRAQLPCTAAIMRCRPDGSDLELVAWGLRNAYGIRFLPDGRLIATDQGADDRGSRPVANAPDLLFEIREGAWYGWPDFIGGIAITDPAFVSERGRSAPAFVLSNHAELPAPERALMRFPPHACAVKFDTLPANAPRWPGQVVVALFGDERPMTAPSGPREGRSLARIDPTDWSLHALADEPLERPIDVKLNPADGNLYVIDFGAFEMAESGGIRAVADSGRLWRLVLD